MYIAGIDHIVLTVRDLQATIRFYEDVLGMRAETFLDGRHCLKFGQQKINLHEAGREFEPKAALPTPGAQDLCFVTPMELSAALEHARAQGVSVELGPVERNGALGAMHSFYVRDPDSNLIEIAAYPRD